MRKLSVLFAGIIFLGCFFAVIAFKTRTASGPKISSANGQGGLTLDYMNGQQQQFSFHASKDASGNVSGSWESNSPGQDVRTHGDITCMTILADGKTAILSGVVTQVDGNGFPGIVPGTAIWFKVRDNGEGSNAVEDAFSDYFPVATNSCVNFNVVLYPIENGNIQVKP
jgi:hypothetical protein